MELSRTSVSLELSISRTCLIHMPDTTETQKDHRDTESYHREMRCVSVGFCASVVSESIDEISCSHQHSYHHRVIPPEA